MALIKRLGFGQVEPNHLSAQRTAQIYAQLPAAADIKVLENGQFVKYDYSKNEVNFTGAGEWMMVWNEIKLYDDFWRETYKDFAMKVEDFTPGSDDITHNGVGPLKGQMVPRVIKTNVGDIYTTNAVGDANTAGDAEYAGIELVVGDQVSPNAKGFLAKDGDGSIVFQVVKVYTMPDGQPAVKLMRIK
jgi:hypothetical protein